MIKVIIIGSAALNMQTNSMYRHPKDLDVICATKDLQLFVDSLSSEVLEQKQYNDKLVTKLCDGLIIECEPILPQSNQTELFNLVINDSNSIIVNDGNISLIYPSLDVLYMLKMSHRYLRNSPAFLKTIRDIKYLRSLGAKFDSKYLDWYKQRELDTYWYNHPNLKVGKNDFFKLSEVPYIYDHDDIHESVKHLDKPAYLYYLKTGEQVMCDKALFDVLPHKTKLLGVLEESYVLALERHQIPNNYTPKRKRSFEIAISKVCTSITSGWFREFAWEHYDEVVELYSDNYVDKFKSSLKNNLIKPFG